MCFRELRDEHVFVIIYAVVASYFAGVMVRLMLTLTPVVCVSAAVALSTLLDTYVEAKEPDVPEKRMEANGSSAPDGKKTKKAGGAVGSQASTTAVAAASSAISDFVSATRSSASTPRQKGIWGADTRLVILLNAIGMLVFFVFHCTWVTSNAYSSPSVVLASTNPDGSQHIIDDYREAYYWLRMNTPQDAVVMSWWDYGYQIAGMADRVTLVDNNTWNNSKFFILEKTNKVIHSPLAHIATVGKAMSSPEEVAYPILRKHDVDYVLVIFGGLLGYSGDDINKFLWMVRNFLRFIIHV